MRLIPFLLPAFLLCSLFACKKPVEHTIVSVWHEKDDPVISKISLFDTLRVPSLRAMDIQEINGLNVVYGTGRKTLYFEYTADTSKLLTLISCLPFDRNNDVSDTTARLQNFAFSQSGKDLISSEEIAAASFFWNINPGDFYYYECLKSPARHTLLIHKQTGRVLHRIETEV